MGKKRKHSRVDNHPYIGACLMGIIMWLISALGTVAVNTPIHMIFENYPRESGPVGILIGSLAAFLFYKFWFRPEFEGLLRGGNMKAGLKMAVPYIAYLVFSFFLDAFFVPTYQFRIIPIGMLFMALVAGFIEECIFRGGILTTLTRRMPGPKRIIPAVLFSSVIFGLAHMTNINAGADIISTIFQTVNAFTTGIVDALIFLVSGYIWPVILMHILHDIVAFSFETVGETVVNWETWLNFGLCTALGVYAVMMLRKPDVQKHILDVWKKKWNETDAAEGSGQEEA